MLFNNGDLVKNIKTGGIYEIIEIDAKDTDHPQYDVVVYRSIKTDQVWVRDKNEFYRKFELYNLLELMG